MKIEPLKVELASLVKSHKKLEEKGHEIDNIKIENRQLRHDYQLIKQENEGLKTRIQAIEDRLLENNVIIHRIDDQAWSSRMS